MSTVTISSFTKFQQSEQEQLGGTLLTTDQKQFIQNLICTAAESRLSLVPDPNNYAEFIQAEAHLKGQMEAYQYLLDCSVASEEAVYKTAAASPM